MIMITQFNFYTSVSAWDAYLSCCNDKFIRFRFGTETLLDGLCVFLDSTMSMIVFIPASVLHCFARILTVVDCTREMNCRTPNIKLHLRTVNDLMTGTILEKL